MSDTMTDTNSSKHTEYFADARQLLQFASASLLWQMACFINSTYFDKQVSAIGIRVNIADTEDEDNKLYASMLVCVDKDNNILDSKVLDRAECEFIYANNFPILAKNDPRYEGDDDLVNNPDDIPDALSFADALLGKHHEILQHIFFDQHGTHIIVLDESVDTAVLENTLRVYKEQLQNWKNQASSYDLHRRMKFVPFLNQQLTTGD